MLNHTSTLFEYATVGNLKFEGCMYVMYEPVRLTQTHKRKHKYEQVHNLQELRCHEHEWQTERYQV